MSEELSDTDKKTLECIKYLSERFAQGNLFWVVKHLSKEEKDTLKLVGKFLEKKELM